MPDSLSTPARSPRRSAPTTPTTARSQRRWVQCELKFETACMSAENEIGNIPTMIDFSKCLWRYAIVSGRKTDIRDASSGDKGTCPLCGNMLVARKGDIRTPHWWHKNGRKCDLWYEPKGLWHLFWQNKFPKEWQEICRTKDNTKHIADVFFPDSEFVIECQYSSMSLSNAKEREDFYGNMLWIVNGTRVNRDKNAGEVFKAIFKFRQEQKGFFVCGKYECCATASDLWGISDVWRNREKIVFFDFDGTFDNPVTETDVFCLLPDEIDFGSSKKRLIVKMSQSELVAGLQEPNGFLSGLRQIGIDYSNSETCKASRQKYAAAMSKADERAKEKARFEEYSRLQRLAIKTSRNIEDLKFEREHPPLYAISCEWLDLWMFLHDHARVVPFVIPTFGFPNEGTLALHNRNSCEAFAQKRLEIIRKFGLPIEGKGAPPCENSCQRHRGAITALARYEVVEEDERLFLSLRDIRTLSGPDGQGRSIKDLCDAVGIWPLTEKVAEILKCEQDIILGSIPVPKEMPFSLGQSRTRPYRKPPSCPKCGAIMIKKQRNSDGGLFWGCPNYPGCHGGRPYRSIMV